MQFTRSGGNVLHYQEIGAPAGKPAIVFINSLGTDFRIWRDVVVALAGDFRVVTYDMRGHGLSDTGSGPYTNGDLVDDLEAVLDVAGVHKVIVCGLSVGGQVALGFYERHPERVEALILSDTAPQIGTDEMWDQRIGTVQEKGLPAMRDAIMERWFTPAFRSAGNAAYAGYCNMLDRQDRDGYAFTCAALKTTDLTPVLETITVPALCIVGDEDGSTPPELVQAMAEKIPGARLEVVPVAGHLPCVEHPHEFADMVRAFVAEVRAE